MSPQLIADLALVEDRQRREALRAGDQPRARQHEAAIARLIAPLA